MKTTQELDDIVTEAIVRGAHEGLASGLEGLSLQAFARARVEAMFGAAWPEVRSWIIERSYRGAAGEGVVEDTLAEVIVAHVADLRGAGSPRPPVAALAKTHAGRGIGTVVESAEGACSRAPSTAVAAGAGAGRLSR